MITSVPEKSIQFIRIVCLLRYLVEIGLISTSEYLHATLYYRKATGADIVLVEPIALMSGRPCKSVPKAQKTA